MKVQVNREMCEGNGKCEAAAPEVFEVREDLSYVLLDDVPEPLRAKVDQAIRVCPRQAISWVGEGQ
jgi:ferredoxin